MNYEVTKSFEFDAAHRLVDYDGKCARIHGHRYKVLITLSSSKLDDSGFVCDFNELKNVVGEWIDENWDHKIILSVNDPLGQILSNSEFRTSIYYVPFNPTAENMAVFLFSSFRDVLNKGVVYLKSVTVFETPTCWATFHD